MPHIYRSARRVAMTRRGAEQLSAAVPHVASERHQQRSKEPSRLHGRRRSQDLFRRAAGTPAEDGQSPSHGTAEASGAIERDLRAAKQLVARREEGRTGGSEAVDGSGDAGCWAVGVDRGAAP